MRKGLITCPIRLLRSSLPGYCCHVAPGSPLILILPAFARGEFVRKLVFRLEDHVVATIADVGLPPLPPKGCDIKSDYPAINILDTGR